MFFPLESTYPLNINNRTSFSYIWIKGKTKEKGSVVPHCPYIICIRVRIEFRKNSFEKYFLSPISPFEIETLELLKYLFD